MDEFEKILHTKTSLSFEKLIVKIKRLQKKFTMLFKKIKNPVAELLQNKGEKEETKSIVKNNDCF